MLVIGVSGWSGSGKDEFAKVALEKFDANRVSFGDVTKEEVREFFLANFIDFEEWNLYGTQEQKLAWLKMPTSLAEEVGFIEAKDRYIQNRHTIVFRCRDFMSWWAMWKMKDDPDYFVKQAFRNFRVGLNIITDLRFPNEAENIKKVGGLLVRISRPGVVSDDPIDHTLDTWEPWDFTYENSGSLETYREWIAGTLSQLLDIKHASDK